MPNVIPPLFCTHCGQQVLKTELDQARLTTYRTIAFVAASHLPIVEYLKRAKCDVLLECPLCEAPDLMHKPGCTLLQPPQEQNAA